MRVIQASAKGMCFGVKDALELAFRLEEPERVTIHGELVHNPVVTRALIARGFRAAAEKSRDAGGEVDRLYGAQMN
jgi:4-hydroxy-3-methylbut-2-en-1-yl diphosphate reductase